MICWILFLSLNFIIVVSQNVISNNRSRADLSCVCIPQKKDFNETINDKVISDCRRCYYFTYDYTKDQNWTVNLCVTSYTAIVSSPLFIVVRESLSVMSFQVPLAFPNASSYSEVCKTLCPLSNFRDPLLQPGPQNISIEISTSSQDLPIDFVMRLGVIDNFIISTDQSITVNITPSKPHVLQYNMEEDLRAVRIEATSKDNNCMLLAIQSIQCPIYDSVQSVEPQGYYQTLIQQSGISITKKTFPGGKQYVVLILKPTDDSCLEQETIIVRNRQKEVTVKIVPSITDEQYYLAVFGAFGFYIILYIFSFVICCFLFVKRRRNTAELKNVNVENPSIQNYGTSSGQIVQNQDNHELDIAKPTVLKSESTSVPSNSRSLNSLAQGRSESPVSFDETDMDKLPDAELDKNVVRTKTIIFVSDLAKKKDKYLSDRSKVYSWNLLTVAIFYGLPVIQLVYINQRIVNLTGNQDVCYYNFLCSHQVGVFSDFNHVYSNIGYVMLGLLFLLLVWRREVFDQPLTKENRNIPQNEMTGIPRHFGLMYAMGWALIMEGVLSASYHVCPNRANFQFDTAFMYVIATVCMLKLYQSRHPDITAKSHTIWMVLAVVIIIAFGGVVKGGIWVWLVFTLGHLSVTFVVSSKIYYMGRMKLDRWLCKRIYHHIKQDVAARSIKPTYPGRFVMLSITVLLNLSLDLFGLIKQPPNFGAFLLSVFIVNLLMYLIYYSIMKIKCKEGIRWIPIMYMILSFICWGFALHFFLAKNTSWQVSPAKSRDRNKHCIILNFFDHHDIWHFLSSCALFFSFMVLFTLDDDLENTPRSKITVF